MNANLHLRHLADAFVQSDSNSYIHSHTDGSGCHARCRPAHQKQFGVRYLAQRYFDMHTRGIGTSDLPITRHWLYPWATAAPLIQNLTRHLKTKQVVQRITMIKWKAWYKFYSITRCWHAPKSDFMASDYLNWNDKTVCCYCGNQKLMLAGAEIWNKLDEWSSSRIRALWFWRSWWLCDASPEVTSLRSRSATVRFVSIQTKNEVMKKEEQFISKLCSKCKKKTKQKIK